MAEITDILEKVRDEDNAKQFTFKKAVSRGLYANTPAGEALFNTHLYESHAPGAAPAVAPAGGPAPGWGGAPAGPAFPLVAGQAYTTRQLELANIYKPNFESNKAAGKAFRLGIGGGLIALILSIGSCVMDDNEAPRVYGYGRHVSTTSPKDAFKGLAIGAGGLSALALAYGLMKRK